MTLSARVLTARGRGAVAVIDLRGPNALDAINAILAESGQLPIAPDRNRPRLRRVEGEEVVIVLGESPVPEAEILELHCHGGTAIVDWVLDRLRRQGASLDARLHAESPSRSIIRAQASALLPSAPTVRTAETLLNQEAGALEQEISTILLELSDHAEAAADRLRRLIDRSSLGLRLLSGHAIVLAGPPNVGKSALFNAIVGFHRAIVSPRAGTTRDALRARLALQGWPIELIDTAGLHEAENLLDRQGVSRAQVTLAAADLVLRVHDLSQPLAHSDLTQPPKGKQILPVASKADLAPAWNPHDSKAIAVSAMSGAGLPELIDAILNRLGVATEALDGPLAVNPSQIRHLGRAFRALERGETAKARRVLSAMLSPWPRPA